MVSDMYFFKRQIKSNLFEAQRCTKKILQILNNIISNEDVLFNTRLVLNELVANGLEHGNQFDDEKVLSLEIKIDDNTIYICVRDEGRGVKCQFVDCCKHQMKTSGRGLFIVKQLSKDLIIRDNEVIAILEGARN